MPKMEQELVQCPALVYKHQKDRLDELSRVTRIPRNDLMREAVEDLLTKHKDKLGTEEVPR